MRFTRGLMVFGATVGSNSRIVASRLSRSARRRSSRFSASLISPESSARFADDGIVGCLVPVYRCVVAVDT